jgi:hypothetical protein
MDQGKRLAILLKISDDLQETLRAAINKDQVSPQKRSEVLSGLASIQREIESLNRGILGGDARDAGERTYGTDDWPEST